MKYQLLFFMIFFLLEIKEFKLIEGLSLKSFKSTKKISFNEACSEFIDNEILFFNKCSFSKDVYNRLLELSNYVLESDPKLQLDDYLQNYLAKNSTFFFRQQYSNETQYLQSLDIFQTDLLKVLDKLKESLSDVKVGDFFDTKGKNKTL